MLGWGGGAAGGSPGNERGGRCGGRPGGVHSHEVLLLVHLIVCLLGTGGWGWGDVCGCVDECMSSVQYKSSVMLHANFTSLSIFEYLSPHPL